MASKFTITAELALQTKNLNQVVNNLRQQFQGANLNIKLKDLDLAQQRMNNINKSVQSTQKSFSSLGNSIGAAAKRFGAMALATGTFVGLTRAIKNSVSEAVEFEREMVKISQAAGRTMSSMKSLQDEIGAVSSSFGVSSKELVGATRNLVQAGFAANKVRDALKLLAQTELSGTFDSIADTTEGVIALLNQFGQQAQKTGTEIDFLERSLSAISKVSKDFAVESSDLITAVRTTGSAFQSAGGDLNELIGLFTSVRATTRESAESIATGFRTIFTRVQRVDTINTLKELGIQLQDIDGKFVGPMEAVKRLSVALNTIDPRDFRFNVIVEELGGFRQVSKVIPLIQQFGTAQKALATAQKSSGELAKDAASAQQALGVQITKVREEFQTFIRELTGSAAFKETVTGALQMASAFIKIADSLKPLLPLITAFTAIKLGSSIVPAIGAMAGIKKRASGGPIGFATGGLVPGSGNGDTVPAMLTPGEFVIKKNSVKALGVEKLASMNKYADGGKLREKYLEDTKGTSIQSFLSKTGFEDESKIVSAFKPSSKIDREFGAVFLRPNDINEDINGFVNSSEIANKYLSTKNIKDNSKKNFYIDAIDKAYGGKGINFKIHSSSIKKEFEQQFQESLLGDIANTVDNNASKLLQSIPDTKGIGKGATYDILKKSNLDQTLGNIFEATLKVASGRFADSDTGAGNQSFDFPTGLGNAAKAFTKPDLANIMTDAKTSFSEQSIGSLVNKVRSTLADEAIKGFISQQITNNPEAIFGTKSVPLKAIQGNPLFQALAGDGELKAKDIEAIANKYGFNINTRGGNYSFTKKANGGAIASLTDIPWMASGGSVGTDTVPAMLTPGEFVINKASAQRIGYGNLSRMNNVAKFATGGPVGVQHFADGGTAQAGGVSPQNLLFLATIAGTVATELSGLSNEWKRAIESSIASFSAVKAIFTSAGDTISGFGQKFKGFGEGIKTAGTAMAIFSGATNGYAAKLTVATEQLSKSVQSSLEKLEKTGGGASREDISNKYRAMGANAQYETALRSSTSMENQVAGSLLSGMVSGITKRKKYSYGGNVDTIPAMLTAGEYVVRKQAVDHYGTGFLDSVNSGHYKGGEIHGFAAGGALMKTAGRLLKSKGTGRLMRSKGKKALSAAGSFASAAAPDLLAGAVSAAPGAYSGYESYQQNSDMPENFAKIGEAAYDAAKALGEFSKISEKLNEASVEKIVQNSTNLSNEIGNIDKEIAHLNELFKKTGNQAYLKAIDDLTDRSVKLSEGFQKLSGELRTRTIKTITDMARVGKTVSEQDIRGMNAQSNVQISKTFEGKIAALTDKFNKAKPGTEKAEAGKALAETQRERDTAILENEKAIIDSTIQIYKQEAALKREEEARNALIGTVQEERGMKLAAQKANYLFERSGVDASRINGDFTKFSAIPDSKSLSIDSNTKDLSQALNFVSNVMGSQGKKLAQNFVDLQDASNILDTAFIELDRGLGQGNINYEQFFQDYFKSQTGRSGGQTVKEIAGIVQQTVSGVTKTKGITPGTLGAGGATKEVKARIADELKKKLEEQLQAIIEVFSNFEGELQGRLSAINESMQNVKELQLESVDSLAKYMSAIGKINNKELNLKQKDYLRQVRQTTLAGKAGGNTRALLDQVRSAQGNRQSLQEEAKRNPFSGGINGVENFNRQMMSLDQTINNSKQALKELANQSDRTSDIMEQIDKEQAKKGAVAGLAKEFTFGTAASRDDLSKRIQALQVAMTTGDINNVPEELRQGVSQLLDQFKDVPLFNGMTGEDVSKKLQYNQLVGSGVNPQAAQSIFTQTSPEKQLIGELQSTFAGEQQAREALAQIEMDTQNDLNQSIRELSAIAYQYLQEAKTNPQRTAMQTAGARGALANQGIRSGAPATAQHFDNLATSLEAASKRIEEAVNKINPNRKSMGGIIYRAGGGGFQPRGTDTVPAMLTPGEFVIKKSAVDAVGVDTLSQINHMASGGYVGARRRIMQQQFAARQNMMMGQAGARQDYYTGSRRQRLLARRQEREDAAAKADQAYKARVASEANGGQGLMPNQRVASTVAGGTRVVTDVRGVDRKAQRITRGAGTLADFGGNEQAYKEYADRMASGYAQSTSGGQEAANQAIVKGLADEGTYSMARVQSANFMAGKRDERGNAIAAREQSAKVEKINRQQIAQQKAIIQQEETNKRLGIGGSTTFQAASNLAMGIGWGTGGHLSAKDQTMITQAKVDRVRNVRGSTGYQAATTALSFTGMGAVAMPAIDLAAQAYTGDLTAENALTQSAELLPGMAFRGAKFIRGGRGANAAIKPAATLNDAYKGLGLSAPKINSGPRQHLGKGLEEFNRLYPKANVDPNGYGVLPRGYHHSMQFAQGGAVGYYAEGGGVQATIANRAARGMYDASDNIAAAQSRNQIIGQGQQNYMNQFNGMNMTHSLNVDGMLNIGGIDGEGIAGQISDGLGQYIGQIVMNMMQKHGVKNTNPNGI